jgi:hypothetical protein
MDESSHEAAHRHAISIHCPNQDEMQMAARVDIAIMRDAASVGLARVCEAAAPLLQQVSTVAAKVVYAQVSARDLMLARSALAITMEAARAMERAFRDER